MFYSDYLHCDLRLSTQRYFVPNGDRILELVVSTKQAGEFAVGVIGIFNLRGGGGYNSTLFSSFVFKIRVICA